jgi:hypothetical protein
MITDEHAPSAIDLSRLPRGAMFMRILGLNYVRLRTEDDGDIYITEYGIPFWRHVQPANWYERGWFNEHRIRLEGSGTVYRVPTRPLEDRSPRSIDLVVKWSRVGEDVPLDTFTLQRAISAEFNTPFEEFSLVESLRRGEHGPRSLQILTQKPLAIYVPPERMQLWQTGRSAWKVVAKVRRHPAVEIDILRSYIMLYAWIDGPNAVDAMSSICPTTAQVQVELKELTTATDADLRSKGFVVADHKPTHLIVRVKDGRIRRRRDGRILYGVVDYELLNRTPEYDEAVGFARRSHYFVHQRDRFKPGTLATSSSQQQAVMTVLGVQYVYGSTASTKGQLWVVGHDAELFGYFLPERWRHKQVHMSPKNQTYYVQTKDRIHLLWKVSNVGELPSPVDDVPRHRRLMELGFNSPFEEFALALEMADNGVRTVHPRAIYATGDLPALPGCVADARRFEQLEAERCPDGQPLMRPDHDYITIWGYWRGLEDAEACSDIPRWAAIDAAQACRAGMLSMEQLREILARQAEALNAGGYEDVNLRGEHVILSYRPGGSFKTDAAGEIELRHCNFEFVRKLRTRNSVH